MRGSENTEVADVPFVPVEAFSPAAAVVVSLSFAVSGKAVGAFFSNARKGSLGWLTIKSLKSA